jgi:ABC-type arginine transport system permease subunit
VAGLLIAAMFAITGLAMIVFAVPFETMSQTSAWNRTGPHSARFYRIMGVLWLLIALVIATLFRIPELHRASSVVS